MRDYEVVDANLHAALRFFGEATGLGEVRSLEGATAIYAGLDYGVFNICMLDQDGLSPDKPAPDFATRMKSCATYFAERSGRWSAWLCGDAVPREDPRHIRAVLAEHNLNKITDAPGMMASALKSPRRILPDIECVAVDSQALRESFASVVGVAFDIPTQIAEAVYHPEGAWRGAYQGFVGRVHGRPISVVAIVAAGGALGVYSLATLPQHRQRGYGEALLRAALDHERERTGITQMVLQSTEAGHSLYIRLGFREVTQFSVYLTK
ncbi:MAG: GNAT family N-acetyltransferase [Acidobacteriota bacterium]